MKNFIKIWKSFQKLDMLKTFRKLGKIYDHNNWSPTYHKDIDESVLKWLYFQVLPFLALNKDLPLGTRYMKEKDFTMMMRIWLREAYRLKKQQHFGKGYFHYLKIIFCS